MKGEGAAGQAVWTRTLGAWHVVFYTMLGISCVAALLGDDLTGVRSPAYFAVVGLLAAAYHFIGRPAIGRPAPVGSHLYRLILVVAMALAVLIYPQAVFLLFVASPQIWLLAERSVDAVLYSIALLAAVGSAQLYAAGWNLAAFREILPWMLISLAVTMLLGLWIEKVIEQSEQRAELIRQLEAARDELAEAHHTAGVMAERERMAREIHDTLAQGMTSIVMLSQTAAVELQRGGSGVAARLAAIEDTARENLAEARALVAAFTPVALSEAPLSEVLRRQAERFAAETGIDVRVSLEDDEVAALPQGQQVVLLRAAQEALANVRKHAGATSVRITLTMTADGVRIEVSDDGSGFDPAAAAPGYGLAAMRGRVEESGGRVQVESAPGRGTRVQVLIPAGGQEDG